MSLDPRYRHRLYLNAYITAANITKDDNITQAPIITQFEKPPYPLKFIYFWPKYQDGVYTVLTPTATPLVDYTETVYAYDEAVPIEISCVSRPGTITGDLLRWKMEHELRNVVEENPYPGSIRHSLIRVTATDRDVGAFKLHTVTYLLRYRVIAETYAPTAPTFAHGLTWTYDGDRLSGGVEGDWDITNHLGGSTVATTINSQANLYLNCTNYVGDAYIHNETSLGISTTLYPTLRVRYKTSGNATVRIDTDDETVMTERSSSTFTTEAFTLTTGQTLDEIRIYLCDNTGTITIDFIQIAAGMYILPNCLTLSPPSLVNDAVLNIPGRVGSLIQSLGARSLDITMTCDLDLEPDDVTWKRPQDDTPKTDANNADIFYETSHLGASDAQNPWTWLDLGEPAMQFKARLVEVTPDYRGAAGVVRLLWREYRHGDASGETTSERFGLSL